MNGTISRARWKNGWTKKAGLLTEIPSPVGRGNRVRWKYDRGIERGTEGGREVARRCRGFSPVSAGNVVFNRIPLRFKGKPCNKLRYLPAWKAIASIGKGPFRMAYVDVERGRRAELFDRLARLHRIVVGRCYISRETAAAAAGRKMEMPGNPGGKSTIVRIADRNRHTFHVGFEATIFDGHRTPGFHR